MRSNGRAFRSLTIQNAHLTAGLRGNGGPDGLGDCAGHDKKMNFLQSLVQKFAGKPIDWDELEESLIRADLGVPLTMRIVKRLKEREAWSITGLKEIEQVVREEVARVLPIQSAPIRPLPGKPKVVLIVGVNGTGKTTSTAKLAHYFKNNRHTVILAAADTFRAAAIEQLGIWADRLGVEIVRGQYNADPAALCYEAYQAAEKRNVEFLLCDTAGRLHTKSNLMAELNKVKRTLAKHDPTAPQESLLVVDATTGGNALSQAREFHQAIGLTGLIVTKLDGSGKGGVVIAIQDELGIPTRFVGTGEKIEDFAPFNGRDYIEGMF
jgi:fused signal recognition particle receptor